jgi:hypothetical protein
MSNRQWFEDEDTIEQVEQCEDCPHPNGCIRECVIANYVHEDVAKIRGEE